jgi:glycosyltransferase involved in cell wall biosynthesis
LGADEYRRAGYFKLDTVFGITQYTSFPGYDNFYRIPVSLLSGVFRGASLFVPGKHSISEQKQGERRKASRGMASPKGALEALTDAGAERLGARSGRPLVSLVVPAFNEAGIVEKNLNRLYAYMETLESQYDWELVFINDGSRDDTGELAETFSRSRPNMRVFHHLTNFGLGQAFKFAFRHCRGDYVVTLDIDLSYAPEHIGRLLQKIRETRAKIVLASPYMEGGTISNVPRFRRILSVWANRFLALFSRGHFSTLTCMVRAYDGPFIRSLNLRATGMEVMPEMIYKAMILRGRIEQIPGHLDWGEQQKAGTVRRSSMRVVRHIIATLVSGFLLRPFMFLVAPGIVLLVFSMWVNFWMVIHFFEQYLDPALVIREGSDRIAAAVAAAYEHYPYSFIVGLLSLMLSLQLIGLGMLALQSKSYFEELFHLASGVLREQRGEAGSKK